LCKLHPQMDNQDYKELIARGLVERVTKNGMNWWNVRFNQIDGPTPEFRMFESIEKEFAAIAEYCRQLILVEGVKPSDITMVYNSKFVRARLEELVAPFLHDLGVSLSVQTNQSYQRNPNVILATTSASYKGYDSEVVIIPGIDFFRAQDKGVLASSLYVAMTRARSILTMFAHRSSNPYAKTIFNAIEQSLDCLQYRPAIDTEISPQDDMAEILQWIGEKNRRWLQQLWSENKVSQEPIFAPNGELIAEPLFWFQQSDAIYACFGDEILGKRAMHRLTDFGIRILPRGDSQL
jgi:hypothetical protein